ncbi:conserved hypothetical protein [Theileria orientalis strain Shintoku]|uniref:Uncharacterized protein n=1 Tax=Theileria orientalis strain Shintoku TaxID=869250 RepID=J4C3V7_THEOR|nr:conserved hypothetical protein [Theileria orientalis strain Shintoku]BAM41111.1 conserved hypothetical protein [Theileria orientalis strain Shintoku]|eukprot:XP_009691412.1 conserved hypothetical protein [Theileria orientalis strain Shintoku]
MEEFEEERIGIHKSVNLHAKRLITSYYSILESCQIDITRDSILRTQVDNFQVKLHNDAFVSSLKTSDSLASLSQESVHNSLGSGYKLASSHAKVARLPLRGGSEERHYESVRFEGED